MPAVLNSAATQDAYVDALTVTFPSPRPGFAVNILNASIFYQLIYTNPNPDAGPRDLVTETYEHTLAPSFTSFRNPEHDGLPPGSQYAGIRLRSAAANTPALVTVL